MTRRTILILTGHYLPGYKAGGPLRSIANLAARLGDEFAFLVLTSDRDLGDNAPYPNLAPEPWVPLGKVRVRYVPPKAQSLFRMARIIRSTHYDVLYLNSFFSPRLTILPLIARRLGLVPRRPLVIAPRGEFSDGALELKAAKKRAYLAIAKAMGLISDVTWQASSDHEAKDIRRALGPLARRLHVAIDLPEPLPEAPPTHEPRTPGAPLRLVFLSRISPMKNLDYALKVLAQVRAPVVFSIYGPAEDAAYAAECRKLAAALPSHVQVRWAGATGPAEVPRIMADHDLFFLPTRGENFGHVIAEALGAGTPVLISDATPWRHLRRLGVGDDFPLAKPAAFGAAIDRTAALSPTDAAEQRARAFAYALGRQLDGADVEANRRLFATLP